MRMKAGCLLLILVLICGCRTGAHKYASFSDNLAAVDPMIGGVGLILQPTRPTVHLPNSLIRSYPVKNDQLDDQIRFFPLCSDYIVASACKRVQPEMKHDA